MRLAVAMLMSSLACVAVDGLVRERDALLSRSTIERVESGDRLLGEWLRGQVMITDHLVAAIKSDTQRSASMKGDFRFLLDQISAELKHAKETAANDRSQAVDVREFGAVGDGVADDGPAIRKAIEVAASRPLGQRCVSIPNGKYKVEGDPKNPGRNLVLSGLNHVTVFGGTMTEILIPQPLSVPLVIRDCDDVRIENLKIRFMNRPFTTGVITERISNDTVRVRIDPGCGSPLAPAFKSCEFRGLARFYSGDLQAGSRRPQLSSILPHQSAPSVVDRGSGLYDFTFKQFLPLDSGYRAGVRIAFYARTYGNHAVNNLNSSRTRLVGISLNSSSAMAFVNINSERPFIADCVVEADPDTYVSTCADGIYLRGGSLGGLLLNNTIRHIGDDFLNIHSLLSPAHDGSGKELILKKQWFLKYLKIGARLGLIPVSTGINEPTVEATILEIEELEHTYKVILDKDFGDLVTNVKLQKHPELKKADFLILLDNQCHGLVIKGNRFEDGLSRMLAGGRNWLFVDNVIADTLNHPFLINLCPEAQGPENAEFVAPRNVTFANNRFSGLQKTLFRCGGSANQFRPIDPEYPTATHIRFENNQIRQFGKNGHPVFNFATAQFVTMTGNRIEADVPQDKPAVVSFKPDHSNVFVNFKQPYDLDN